MRLLCLGNMLSPEDWHVAPVSFSHANGPRSCNAVLADNPTTAQIVMPSWHCLQAVRTGLNAKAQGDTGRVMVVLLTDGRANVSLAKSNEDPEALAEGAPKASKVRLHASW